MTFSARPCEFRLLRANSRSFDCTSGWQRTANYFAQDDRVEGSAEGGVRAVFSFLLSAHLLRRRSSWPS